MTSIASLAGQEFIWEKSKEIKRARQIVIDGESWCSLRRLKMFGSLVGVESKAGSWTLKRVGFFRTRITIRQADSDQNVGLYTPSFTWCGSAGTVEIEGGRSYRWGPIKSLGREHAFFDSAGTPLLRFRGSPRKCRMTFEAKTEVPDLPLLAALGYYILLLHDEDTAVVVTASAAAAASG
jgi:hypothetical protein